MEKNCRIKSEMIICKTFWVDTATASANRPFKILKILLLFSLPKRF